MTEAQNPKEEEFGEDRFGAILVENRNQSAEEIINIVNAALTEWAAGGNPADDITMVVAKRN